MTTGEIGMRLLALTLVLMTSLAHAQAPVPTLAPPVARMTPRVDTTLGDVRIDNYYWIRDDARKNPDVIAYLEAENRYTQAVMKPLEPLVQKLYEEMKGRIKETDLSVPERVGNYYYYTLMVKDLTTGQLLPDRVPMVNYSLEWAGDNKTLFYGMGDSANRSYRILRHPLGSNAPDAVIAEEPDDLFGISLEKTKDRKFILINDGSFSSTEFKYLRADEPMGTFKVIQPKTKDLEYSVEHHGDKFLIVTNDGA